MTENVLEILHQYVNPTDVADFAELEEIQVGSKICEVLVIMKGFLNYFGTYNFK